MDTELNNALKAPIKKLVLVCSRLDFLANSIILELTAELGCVVDKISYQHKDKPEIVLDFIPEYFSRDDYDARYTIVGDSNHLKFLRYLITKRNAKILELNSLMEEK